MRRFGFKLVLIGDESVGKTSLVIRYVQNKFGEQYIKTIGADFLIKDITLFNSAIRLILWDLAGERQWTSVRELYMRGADGCVLIYDTSKKQDLREYLQLWTNEIHPLLGETIPLIVVGNKIDLEPGIDLKEAANIIGGMNYPYIETSAKTGGGVELMFQRITEKILKSKPELLQGLKKE